MWVNRGRLPHLLPPSAYVDEAQYRLEIERLFTPGWCFAGTTHDLAAHGDFLTFEAFGHPILVRNDQGTLSAYLNVCAHRHAKLRGEAHGRCDVLRCQYHGWEYAPDGTPKRVREAALFAPIPPGAERLQRLRLATLGQLLFVSLGGDQTLEDWLAPRTADLCRAIFSADDYRQIARFRIEHPANWKIPIENGIESYHVPIVHPKTFASFPDAAVVRHELAEGYTVHEDVEQRDSRPYRVMMRLLRAAPSYRYTHLHRFPNLTFVHTDVSSYVQAVIPTSPTTSVSHVRSFIHRGDGRGLVRRLASRALATPIAQFTARVLAEDGALFGEIQQGMRASRQPGVLAACEERIFAFQSWLVAETHGSERDRRALGRSSFADQRL